MRQPSSLTDAPPHLSAPPSSPHSYSPPRVLESVAEVLAVTAQAPLVCVYFYAQWCSTCKRADPLYEHATCTYASSPILFANFDCGGAEEKLSEDTFNLQWVPTWKIWQNGTLIRTIEGDWTQFEPTLQDVVGPPSDEVAVDPELRQQMDEAWLRFVEVAEGIKKRQADEARRKLEGESDSESSGGSSGSEDGGEDDATRSWPVGD